ncbi:unnamed protein product [Calicophoron daubneyi]|uniref:Huntingtin n=1 Tax=Calicophoron daubneyi TaxID=300641 RepID=A0AAV2TC14_CALDB
MGSVGEVGLVSALRALGAIQGQSLASPTAGSAVPQGAESASSSTAVADATEAEQKLSRLELLRVTHHLVGGLLSIQAKAPSSTPSYLSVVLPCLFKLLNNTHQDVRIAADEGINKLIKLLRVSMTHQIICELFLELKRNQSARTVSACLSKFAMLVHRIRPSKRRFYTANLLPVLSAICEREDEQVFEALLDYFTQIAAQLFYYASEKELRELNSSSLNLPHPLHPRPLLRSTVELNSLDNPVTGARCAGLFNTLRYLSIAWQQIVNINPNAALFEAQRTMASTVRPKSGSSNPSQITANSDVPLFGTARNPSSSLSQPSEHDVVHMEDEMWSYALFTCLNHVSHPSITVSTAALETLLQLFTTRRPAYLYPRRWLSRNMNWSAKGPEMILSTESSIIAEETINSVRGTSDDQAEAQFRELERTGTQPSFDAADMQIGVDGDLKLVEPGISDGGRGGGLTRSVSSASLCSAADADSGIAGVLQNEVQKQLSAVKARLAKEEEEKLINRPARDTEEFSGDADYSIIDTIPSSSDQSVVDRIHTSGSISENMATKYDRSINNQAKLLTLSELLSYLAPEDPIPLSESYWLLPYFALHFCLLPSETCAMYPLPMVAPRTSSQLLVVACLTQLVQLYPQKFVSPIPVDRCCSATQSLTPHDASFPTGVDIVLHLLQKHSDPQLRGQVCLLIGSLISSYLVRMAVDGIDQSDLPCWADVQAMFHKLLDAVESLLTSTTPGTTFRLALASLRSCANSILTVPEPNSESCDGSLSLVDHLVDCISRCLVPAARHSYRLVRREFLLLVSQLDWVSINFMETEFFKQPPIHLVRPSRLIDVAWNETWRLLSDSESELRDLASASLVGLSSTLGSMDDCHIEPLTLLVRSLERRLHYWYPQSFSYARLPIMSFGLVDCWSDQSLPPCLSGLPTELDVGPGGLQSFSSHRAHLLYLESTRKSKHHQQPRSPVGVWRLFRDCMTALMELPCPSAFPDDRYMLHGVIRCLNQLIGHSHVMAYADIWYDTSPSTRDGLRDETLTGTSDEDPQTLLSRQRRPRIAMLSWQSLTLLSAAPVTTIDLDLHCELINLCSGCLTRWALFAMTEGSVPTKLGSLGLDLHHTYTRFALSLLHHVARVLFIFWHVIEDITPSPPPAGVALADPLNPGTPVSIFNTIAQVAQTSVGRLATGVNVAPTKTISTPAAASDSVLTTGLTDTSGTSHRKRPVSIKLGGPMRKSQDAASSASETRASSNVRRILGYFNHLPHYMELYKTLRTAFQTFKISPDPSGSQDRFMGLLQAYLHTLNRIMGNLRLAETAPYSDELLTYVRVLYHLQPAACLDAASQILRAFVGTNLISHWDGQLVRLYDLALNPSDSNCSLGKSKAEGQKIEDASSDSAGSETADGLTESVNLLLKQHRMFVDLLVSPELDTNLMASWLKQTQLARAPMTAWIRFARRWRVPVPLSSRASSIKSELEHFFKKFEFIVIHSMESYKWTNCSPLQSGILNLLTHLICLRLNYDQLDTGQRFLKTVLNHCEDLPLEVQRQQTHLFKTLHFGARKLRGLGIDSQTHSSSLTSDYFHSQYLQNANSDQQLVNAMFRFLVLRMAETLAAEGLDPSSIVLSALVPIVVDLFVIQRPLWTPALNPPSGDNATKNPASDQAEVQREAVLNFLLRRLSHLPASYDQLCLIVEESALQYDDRCSDPASTPDDRTERIVSQVFETVLSNLTSGKTVFRTRADISALLRLFDHIILALSSRRSIVNSDNECIRKAYADLIHRLIETIFATETPKAFDCRNTISNNFYCWAVGQVACVRLLIHLLLLLVPKSDSDHEPPISAPQTEGDHPSQPSPRKHQLGDVLRVSILSLHRVIEALETLLRENPHLASLLATLRLSESGLTTSLLMLCQIGLTHLLTLNDLTEPSRYALLCTTYQTWETGSSYSDGDAEPPDLEQLSRHIRSIGTFEPLFYILWCRLTSTVPKFTALVDQSLDVPFCGTTGRLLNTELMAHIALLSSAQMEVNNRKKNSVMLAKLCRNSDENSFLTFRRLITMWDSDEGPIRSLLSNLAKNKIRSQQLLDICDKALPTMSLAEMRTVLRLLPCHLHPSTARKELALLWDHFISPMPGKASTASSSCFNCRRTPLPLALQHSAAQEACRLLEKVIVITNKNGKMSCLIPPETLTSYHARLPSSRILPSMAKLDQLLRRIIGSQSQTAPPAVVGADTNANRLDGINRVNVTKVLRQIESANNVWLLNCARATLLDGCCCSTNVRMVVRLLHALVSDLSETAAIDLQIHKMLHTCCFRCCPRLLQYILTLRPTPSVSTADHYVDANSEHQSSAVTPRVDKLFRLGQQLLFEKIHQAIANPEHLFEEASDPILRDALQSYLTGLTAAVVQFLGLIPQLPAVDASPMESETLALSFLRVMIQFILWSMGYVDEINYFSQHCPSGLPSGFPLSVTLIQSVLQLLDSLLHTVSTRLGKGVDILGDNTETTLALFITFLGAIDQSASLSQSLTWRTRKLPAVTLESGRVGLIQSPLLSSLLVPCQPSLFGPWYPDPVPASTLAWFTLAATSSTASTVLGGNGFRLVQPFGTNGFVQPCQLLSKCRLIRSTFNLPTNPALITLVNTCLSSCVRLLNTSTGSNQDPSTVNHPSSVQLGNLSSISLLGLDPDVLCSVICRVGGLGWLDRRQFEQIWMAYLELLAGTDNDYVHADGGSGGGGGGGLTEFESTDLELIEHNQSVVLALHGLTRLLLDVTLRPEPGDPVHSRLHHQPRCGTSHFSYTKLGRKLTSLVALIESGRLNLLNKHNPPTQNTDVLSNLVTAGTAEQGFAGPTIELTSMVEPDLERPTDSTISEGPSQFAVDWLVRRLDSARAYQSDNSTSPITIIQKSATSPSNRYATDYEDLLFSCLQSVQLLYQSCLKPLQAAIPIESSPLESQQFVGPDGEVLANTDPAATPHSGTLSRTTARSTTLSPATTQYNKSVALAVRSSVIRSAVILSDLFTSRDQFMWLNGYLRESISKLPPLNEFQAPIHIWLTLGMAKCTAVLELAHSAPNTERLHPAALEPAVRQTLLALQSNLTPVQDAGMEAAIFLLHAALLIRAQPHQRQMQQHSPPTGSPLLNELYSQVCGYVEQKLATLFAPVPPIRLAAEGNTLPVDVHQFQSGTLPRGSVTSPIPTTTSSSANVGLKRFMMGVFGGMGAGSKSASGTPSTEPYDITAVTSNVASPACTLVDRVERHQLTVLATAFFLTEHFSDPPVYPVVTDSGSGLTEMLSGLTSSLFRLASPMLTDAPSSSSKQSPYSQLGAGTTSELCCSPAVHTAWCRGAERLILTGRLGKGATESLQKLCITRLRTCRSPHLSLPILRLLVTCMYVNASRLNTQLQRYRRFTSATVSHGLSSSEPVVKTKLTDHAEPTSHSNAAEGSSATTLDQVTVNANEPTDEITVSSQGHSATYVRADTTTEDADSLVLSQPAHSPLPPSLVMDSEGTAGMTQEFLSCLWERLRGGVSPIGLPSNSNAAWINNAWTSFTEASIIAQLLPATSTEIIEAVLGVLVTWSSNQEARLDQRREESVADPVLNKALGEFARLDHAHPDLAAQTLAQLFALFMENEGGQCLVRQWVLLSLPTLLGRQPRRLAIWATTVCLLAASTHPALRAAFCLCCCSRTPAPKLGTADRQEPNNTPSAMCSSSTIGDLLCLAAVHFTEFGLLRKIEGSGPECMKRNEEREVYLSIFQPPNDTQDLANVDENDRHDIRTLNHVYSLIRDSVRN